MKIFFSRQFVVFVVAGSFAALVNFLSRFIYSLFLDFSYAVTLAYATGMVVAFILFKLFVFKPSHNSINKSISLFFLVNIISFSQTYAVSMVLVYHVLPDLGVHVFDKATGSGIGIVVPVITSFIGHKYFTFKEKNA